MASYRYLFLLLTASTGEIFLAQGLDFENTLIPRRFQLQVLASDGSCVSETVTLTLDIVDINEKPAVSPRTVAVTVNEGPIDIDPSRWSVSDQDIRDDHTYEIRGGNTAGHFVIDARTGRITSDGDYDVDPNEHRAERLTIRVTDKGGLTDDFFLKINIQDINDNPPIINPPNVGTFHVTNCTQPGTVLGTPLTATDNDSSLRGNNQVYFESASSGPLAVDANGNVILTSRMMPGQTASIQVHARDQGRVPHPLTSTAVHISVAATRCHPTRPSIQPPSRTPRPLQPTRVTTTPKPGDDQSEKNWFDDNLPWVIFAALLGTILLGLALWMCLRYIIPLCQKIRICKSKPRLRKWTPVKEKRVKPLSRPSSIRRMTPVEKPDEPLPLPTPTPPLLHIVGPQDGELMDFWKEHYNEADFQSAPPRNTMPKPTWDAVNPLQYGTDSVKATGTAVNNGGAAKQPKSCLIQ